MSIFPARRAGRARSLLGARSWLYAEPVWGKHTLGFVRKRRTARSSTDGGQSRREDIARTARRERSELTVWAVDGAVEPPGRGRLLWARVKLSLIDERRSQTREAQDSRNRSNHHKQRRANKVAACHPICASSQTRPHRCAHPPVAHHSLLSLREWLLVACSPCSLRSGRPPGG